MLSCKQEKKINTLELGTYQATLKVNDTELLPFNFEVISANRLRIFNAEEIITVNNIEYKNVEVSS